MDSLKDGPYNPNMTGLDLWHKIMAEDQEWGGKRRLDTNIFYPEEHKSVYYKDNKLFEQLVNWKG